MRITLSVIKADIGSIGGHLAPSQRLLETVREHVREQGRDSLIDSFVSHTGDDVAILMTHDLFDETIQKTQVWLNEIRDELEWDHPAGVLAPSPRC